MADPNQEVAAKALLNFARQYRKAAEIVFEHEPVASPPLYQLYFHTVELLLRSYLQASGKNPRKGHKISHLYKQARQLGLAIEGDPLGLQNIVNLLERGNTGAGFRYFTRESGSLPEISWTREVVGRLLEVVSRFLESRFGPSVPGPAVKLVITFSKPADSRL